MHKIKVDLQNHLQDIKADVLSNFVTDVLKSVNLSGFSDVEFLEGVADYINQKYGYEQSLIIESLAKQIASQETM